tara:strand:- start:562 stop:777 length:216 start_codon:yes stop_codon:yes gene_type:complete
MKYTFLPLLLILSGCAAPVLSNSDSITFSGVRNINIATTFPLAQQHCESYGKNAVPQEDNARDGYKTFLCR